jgi:hypothetical protein
MLDDLLRDYADNGGRQFAVTKKRRDARSDAFN